MNTTKTFNFVHPFLLACLLLPACAPRPELVSRSAGIPAGVDFSGRWQLRIEPGANPMPSMDAGPGIRIPPANRTNDTRMRPSKRSLGTAVNVFIENGQLLKISQTLTGLFISFDRAIVEEYTFGENRVVSVGPIEAQRVSGWQARTFVIETMDDDGALLTERWYMDASDDVLVREISVVKNDREKLSSRQRFDRI